jgi:hypothetical protein
LPPSKVPRIAGWQGDPVHAVRGDGGLCRHHLVDPRLGGQPERRDRYELEVIAMVVISGTVLNGGRGTILGTMLGVLILRLMRNGIVLIGVPGLAYNIFIGAALPALAWLAVRPPDMRCQGDIC